MTGFMMWFPMAFTQVLPGYWLNVALVIHSNEALLAMGVIFIFVHFFSAHLKPESFPLDKAIFTGSLPVDHYKAERPLEYARRVRAGTLDEVLVEKHITWEDVRGRCDLVDDHADRRRERPHDDRVHHLVGVRLSSGRRNARVTQWLCAAGPATGEVGAVRSQFRRALSAAAPALVGLAVVMCALALSAAPAGAFGQWQHDGATGCSVTTTASRPMRRARRATRGL